ncbi:Mitochondrial inner membrane protein COX18like [Caligus rogercresseyi]|uniref:Mitochondrial inner membrane protein COX18like n=1 Tax=Caligus rogercresseyi TaxID=217165 RepID=A0A7T8HHS9_CALRO|nr:Mitochondrial inner membrane protein COX18like [Caligus rogercresseyi]
MVYQPRIPDPYYVLPLVIGATLIVNQEVSSRLHQSPEGQKLPLPIRTAKLLEESFPSSLYHSAATYPPDSHSTGPHLLLMQPRTRRLTKIPLTPHEPSNPLRVIKGNFQKDFITLKDKIQNKIS